MVGEVGVREVVEGGGRRLRRGRILMLWWLKREGCGVERWFGRMRVGDVVEGMECWGKGMATICSGAFMRGGSGRVEAFRGG